jgi:hypothetical protein
MPAPAIVTIALAIVTIALATATIALATATTLVPVTATTLALVIVMRAAHVLLPDRLFSWPTAHKRK